MNYQHAFHAGSAADVIKHVVLTAILARLTQKPKPLFVLDTHAGMGIYRLDKNSEADSGIRRLWPTREAFPKLAPYFTTIALYNGSKLRDYPGSPLFITPLLRPIDRFVAVEAATEAHAALQQNLRHPRSHIFLGSAWQALPALLPPPEHRGLIFIDPPYESQTERRELITGLTGALTRFRQGVYCVWYPIKDRREADRLKTAISTLGPSLVVELLTLPDDIRNRLNGSGLVIINPPFGLKEDLNEVLPTLAQALTGDGTPRYSLR